MERDLRLAINVSRISDWLAAIVATSSGAILLWVAIGWIIDSGRPGYVFGYLTASFVFAIGRIHAPQPRLAPPVVAR